MAPELTEHRWIVIVQIGDGPVTDVIEQCAGCAMVRHTRQSAHYDARGGGSLSHAQARYYFRNGLPALPNEDCP